MGWNLYTTQASIILVNQSLDLEQSVNSTLIRVEDAYQAFAALLEFGQKNHVKTGIDEQAFIHDSVKTGKDVYIGPFVYIGKNVRIGNNVKIHPHVYIDNNCEINDDTTILAGVKIYNDCKIGKNCIIHAGVVIGSDGFGFAPQNNSNYKKVPQVGNVIIGNDVEIGANTTIDRATIGSTIIHNGVKLDNLIQVAHNVEIGENTVIAAQSGISGSTKIGKNCIIAGQVGIAGHITVGDNVTIGAQSGISNNKKSGEIILGSPAFNIADSRKSIVVYRNLPKLRQQVINLEKQLDELKNILNT